MAGLQMPSRSISGSISFWMVVVAGYIRVPRPAAVTTAFRTLVNTALLSSPRYEARAEGDRARRAAHHRSRRHADPALVLLAHFVQGCVGIRRIGGAEYGYGSPGSAAGDLGPVETTLRSALADQLHQQIGFRRAQVQPLAVGGVGGIHQTPGFDHRLHVRLLVRTRLLATHRSDLHQREEVAAALVLQDRM